VVSVWDEKPIIVRHHGKDKRVFCDCAHVRRVHSCPHVLAVQEWAKERAVEVEEARCTRNTPLRPFSFQGTLPLDLPPQTSLLLTQLDDYGAFFFGMEDGEIILSPNPVCECGSQATICAEKQVEIFHLTKKFAAKGLSLSTMYG